MKSIDNLREWWQDRFPVMDRQLGRDFREHIDAIEREVEDARDRDYRNGREDAEGAVEFADRLKASATNRADVTLFGVDYIALPVDADGEAIHVGDVMELDSGAVEEVESMHYYGNGGWTTTTTHNATAMPSIIRHHHAPTVEDVLREFGKRWDDPAHYAKGELVETFAAKLRLAGEGE